MSTDSSQPAGSRLPWWARIAIVAAMLAVLPVAVGIHRLAGGSGRSTGLRAEPGWGPDSGTAPDPTGGISPRWYVQLVNRRISIWTRSLRYAGPDSDLSKGIGRLATLATGNPNSQRQVFDPQMMWDRSTNRFYYVAADRGELNDPADNGLAFGWTKTSDPRDVINGWCRYEVRTPGHTWDDYPKVGDGASHLIIGSNRNRDPTGEFTRAWLTVVSKPPPGPSCPRMRELTIKRFGPLRTASGGVAATVVPANGVDGSRRGYVVAADHLVGSPHEDEDEDEDEDEEGGGKSDQDRPPTPETEREEKKIANSPPRNTLTAWHIEGSRTHPRLVLDGNLRIRDFYYPGPIPQIGSSTRIDPLDARLTQAVANKEPAAGGAQAVWTVHTVAASRGGRAQVRWYELLPSRCRHHVCPSSAVRQAGIVAKAGDSVFLGAISPDLSGASAALNFNVSGPLRLVDIRTRVRQRSTPLGQMVDERVVERSKHAYTFGCQPVCRWGDYAGASPDPTHDGVVWGTSELVGPTLPGGAPHWFTRIFRVPTGHPASVG